MPGNSLEECVIVIILCNEVVFTIITFIQQLEIPFFSHTKMKKTLNCFHLTMLIMHLTKSSN